MFSLAHVFPFLQVKGILDRTKSVKIISNILRHLLRYLLLPFQSKNVEVGPTRRSSHHASRRVEEIRIWYATQGGTARRVAVFLGQQLRAKIAELASNLSLQKVEEDEIFPLAAQLPSCSILSVEYFDPDTFFLAETTSRTVHPHEDSVEEIKWESTEQVNPNPLGRKQPSLSCAENDPHDRPQPQNENLRLPSPRDISEKGIETRVSQNLSLLNVFVVSTYSQGTPPPTAQPFANGLEEASRDFRIPANAWEPSLFAVFGCGDESYGGNYNRFARRLFTQLRRKGAQPLLSSSFLSDCQRTNDDVQKFFKRLCVALRWCPLVRGSEGEAKQENFRHVGRNIKKTTERSFFVHQKSFWSVFSALLRNGMKHWGGRARQEVEASEEGEEKGSMDEDEEENSISASRASGEFDIEEIARGKENPREMLNPRLREGLTRQGYGLLGSHSGVKLCRWTKSMLRGRGGCYKHSFYGIASLACMEMTPSLACANKCVFCWRHHTNPTSREWHWKHDPPEFVLRTTLEKHRQMIKTLRGVPGVTPKRLEEAMHIRHCALSLVGEPIIYPEISSLIRMFHENHISTFLVTNAQFPEELEALAPVTQLYVSVDAGNKTSLQKIDRPLFEDFWERFLSSLKILGEKAQRTVYRLTLVKSYNIREVEDYAALVSLGHPRFYRGERSDLLRDK